MPAHVGKGQRSGRAEEQGASRGARVACEPSPWATTALDRQHSTNHFPRS
jgi:hypothetical protein